MLWRAVLWRAVLWRAVLWRYRMVSVRGYVLKDVPASD
jgi:hypothetical protein